MQWLIHTFRTLWHRNRAAGVGAVALPVVLLVGIGVGLGAGSGGGGAVAPDPAEVDYTAELLDNLGTDPAEFAEDLFAELVPGGLSADDSARVLGVLALNLGADGDADPTAAVVDGLVRRLGLAAGEVDDTDELIALALAAIDPDGSITDADSLIAAIETWFAASSPHVLRIAAAAEASGALADLDRLAFEDAVAILDGLAAGAEVLDVGLGGIEGLEPLTVPGIAWEVDVDTRSISFSGDTAALGGATELLLSARWGPDPAPTLVAAMRVADWRLRDAGFDGDLGDTALPAVTFLLADRAHVLGSGDVSVDTWADLTGDHGGPLDELVVERGINALSAIAPEALPTEVVELVGATAGGERLGVRASLGPAFGVVSGDASPTRATLAVSMPGIDPPSLPAWLSPSDALPWALTLTAEAGRVDVGLAGGLDAFLDGADRSFAATFALSADGSSAQGRLEANLRETWDAPFGLDWLTFSDLTMSVDLDDSSAEAGFVAELFVAQRAASLEFTVAAEGSSTAVEMLASIDRLSADDVVAFLAETTPLTVPADLVALPQLAIDDVLVDIRAGAAPTVAVGGRASVAGQSADVLFSIESPGGADPGVVLGVALDSWRLVDAIPALGDTLLADLEFPPTSLVLSAIEGSVDPAELSRPAQRFFAGLPGGSATLQLAPGLSVFGSLDLAGTALEDPLAALGFDDGQFPLVGTLPGSVLGIGGSSGAGGSALSDLALSVQLPEIQPGDAPEWFRGGQLSLVATGAPSLGLEGRMTVMIDGEELTFLVGAEFSKTPLGAELGLFGALETERPWESPFGIDWLVVNGLAIELTIAPTGTVGLGFAGDIVIGDKDLRAALGVDITPAGVPSNLIVAAASEEGISTNDLFAVQQAMASAAGSPVSIDTSGYPELLLRDIELRFAPQGSERLGVEAGFVVAGDAYAGIGGGAPQRFAFLDFRLTEDGLFATGELAAWELGPLEWSDIVLDLELSRNAQRFLLDGEVSLLGLSADVEIDLSTDSIVFAGRQAIEDLERIVDLMERAIADPAGSIEAIPSILADAGVATPPWLADLLDQLADLTRDGQQASELVIDTILTGGTVPLIAFPAGGVEPVCPAYGPFEEDGRCYTTPSVTSGGLPAGGASKTCIFPLGEKGGKCWTTKPTTIEVCTPNFLGIDICIDEDIPGTPRDGLAKTCPLLHTEQAGRCWTVPPGEIIPAIPDGGVDRVCPLTTPIEDGGRCWIITPTAAGAGLGVQGVCAAYPEVSCTVRELVSVDVLRLVFQRLVARLSDW